MKKVLIVTSGLTHGGVNRSLLSFLEVMSNKEYKFEVFSLYSYGPYLKLFKKFAILTVFDIIWPLRWIRWIVSKETKVAALVRQICDFGLKLFSRTFHRKTTNIIAKALSKIDADVVISFQEGFTTEIVSLVRANNRIAWVHCDYSRYKQGAQKDESFIYERYTHIVCVSEYTASVFKSLMPTVKERVVAIHNIMDADGIHDLSLADMVMPFLSGVFNLVSIGRLDPVKRFSFIPSISKQLKDNGVLFRWYIIGDGGTEKETIISSIKENAVENEVVLLGEIDNPYPYVRYAQALVCLSSSEACPNVIHEAKILHTPVVTTNFPSVGEYVNNGECGLISEIDDIHSAIEMLYYDHHKYEQIKTTISKFEYDNAGIVCEVEKIIDHQSLLI